MHIVMKIVSLLHEFQHNVWKDYVLHGKDHLLLHLNWNALYINIMKIWIVSEKSVDVFYIEFQ